MCWMHNEGKSVIAERFIRIIKNKFHKYMTLIWKNVYIDRLDDIVNKYNNTYHRTIKMEAVDVKSSTYIASSKDINDEDPKFEIDDIVGISKYKNSFTKGYAPRNFLWLKKLNILCLGHMLLVILKGIKSLERFT